MYELRWFLEDKGNNWQQVKNWFYHLPTPPELDADREPKLNFDNIKKVRMEVYFQCREDIGLKLSRGGLQIKIRSRKAELFHSDAAAEGFLEYWEKKTWKYLDNEGNDRKKKKRDPVRESFEAEGQKGKRFRTQKVRRLRKFDFNGVEFIPVDPNKKVAKGLIVELAWVKINYWSEALYMDLLSLQFELVSEDGENEEDKKLFKKGIEWTLKQKPGLKAKLKSEESMSYPGFFEQLTPVVYQAGEVK